MPLVLADVGRKDLSDGRIEASRESGLPDSAAWRPWFLRAAGESLARISAERPVHGSSVWRHTPVRGGQCARLPEPNATFVKHNG